MYRVSRTSTMACCRETNHLQQGSIATTKKEEIFMLVVIKSDNQQQYDKKNEKIQLTPLLERPNIT